MKNVLFAATVDQHILAFHLPFLKWFKDRGWRTHVAAKGDGAIPWCDVKHAIEIERNPYNRTNLKGYRQLKRIMEETSFDLVHCHTPMGGVLARLAARSHRMAGVTVLYTAHGFHFYRKGPRASWLVYFPIEWLLSWFTDGLITINSADYAIACERLHAEATFLSLGVGYDETRFFPVDPEEKEGLRKRWGYAPDDILLIYVAELNENKNQGFLIDALKLIRQEYGGTRLLLVGEDCMNGAWMRRAAELNLTDAVDFLGQRQDVDRLIPMCDIAVASSLREGLGINVLEAMACGLPVVATRNNGHRELITDGVDGFLVFAGDTETFAERVKSLLADEETRHLIVRGGLKRAKDYTRAEAVAKVEEIYEAFISHE